LKHGENTNDGESKPPAENVVKNLLTDFRNEIEPRQIIGGRRAVSPQTGKTFQFRKLAGHAICCKGSMAN